MAKTAVDLYAFGNQAGPRPPRLGTDLFPDANGDVGPNDASNAVGASTFADVSRAPLRGHYHRLPAGTDLPAGLEVVADGCDVIAGSACAPTHHTCYPAVKMPHDQFAQLYLSLPWEYGGRK